MRKRLGLDLGSNSIGWALIDPDKPLLLDAGVRVFPEGVDRDRSGGEVSKSEKRRVCRGARRRTARRRKRVAHVKRLLIANGLLPEVAGRKRTDPDRQEWEKTTFAQSSPYQLRGRALDEKLAAHEVGRAILHLAQRRGFWSNRKATGAERKEESETLAEIEQLQKDIDQAECRTLGEYLGKLHQSNALQRLRGRHTRRRMYKHEFETIWSAQQKHHPELLTEVLKGEIHHAIFHQRPLKIPKSMIGTCELETNRRRCPRADRRAQRFRLLMEVNNLRVVDQNGEDRPLTGDERAVLIEYLSSSDRRTFDQIRKKLGFNGQCVFNLERAKRKSLQGHRTDTAMKKALGRSWAKLDEEKRNTIVRSILEDSPAEIAKRAVQEWNLNDQQAQLLPAIELPQGYSAFSREAINKLLPHIEAGHPLMSSDDRPCAITLAGYLRPDQRPQKRTESLPQPPDLPNPIVRAALHEVRKVVNAVLRAHGPIDEIHIELTREVKGSLARREEHIRRMRQREKLRDAAADAIRQAGFQPSRESINRYLLWEEQERHCIYSGKPISMAQLLGGAVDVDHILPRSRSLDDSLMNKVVAFRADNADKGNRTVWEWLGESAPDRYDEILLRARKWLAEGKLPYGKFRKLQQKNVELDDFIHRQLNDTAYITRAVAEYLRCLVENPHRDMLATKGQLTAKIRHAWGLNEILRDDGLNLKTREDHRHHAIDAIVTAFVDRSLLQQLSRLDTEIKPPTESFRQDVETILNNMNVSHRVRRGIQGALHEDTHYGPTDQAGVSVYRKPVESLTLNEVEHIRDEAVKRKVIRRLEEFGLTAGRQKKGAGSSNKIPGEVWAETLWMNQDKEIPIKKVRIEKTDATVQPIRAGSVEVKPGNTHHVAIFELPDGKRVPLFVTMLEAAKRARQKGPNGQTVSIVQRNHPDYPEARFIMSLSSTELLLANWKGQSRLLQFRTCAQTQGQLYFADARDARPASQKEKFVANANTLDARKVTVSPLGELRWAND